MSVDALMGRDLHADRQPRSGQMSTHHAGASSRSLPRSLAPRGPVQDHRAAALAAMSIMIMPTIATILCLARSTSAVRCLLQVVP
jgi:hypothetical protein